MKRVTASAGPSSANLGHGFDVLAVALESPDVGRDRVTVELARRWEVLVEGPAAGAIPADPARNSAALAARALTRKPLRLRLWKVIPSGSGLGGSGASAAAAVRAVDALLGLALGEDRLLAAAAEGERASAGAPHADNVTASLLGGLVCVTGFMPLSWSLPKHVAFALALPALPKTTRRMRRVVPRSWPLALHTHEMARAVATAMLLARGEIDRVGTVLRDSIVEQRRSKLLPGHPRAVDAAVLAGAPAVTISGAGPAIVAIVDSRRTDPGVVAANMTLAFLKAGIPCQPATAKTGTGARVEESR